MRKLINKIDVRYIAGILALLGIVLFTGYEDQLGNIQWPVIIIAIACLAIAGLLFGLFGDYVEYDDDFE